MRKPRAVADLAIPVIDAVLQRLKTYQPVIDLVGGAIFTDIPEKQEFPYVMLSCTSEPFAADDFSGQQHTFRVQAHSRKKGKLECLQIRAAAFSALDRMEDELELSEGNLVKCEYTGLADAFREDDGKTWQSVIEFNIITQ